MFGNKTFSVEPIMKIHATWTTIEQAEEWLKDLGVLTFGIESISLADRTMRYVNLGDTYIETILEENGELSVGSWGSWYEEAENAHCEANGLIRCGYCSEFTPVADNWRDTFCEYCGNNVGG